MISVSDELFSEVNQFFYLCHESQNKVKVKTNNAFPFVHCLCLLG